MITEIHRFHMDPNTTDKINLQVDKLKNILSTKCAIAYQKAKQGVFIYRGAFTDDASDIFYENPLRNNRVSANLELNIYNILMSNSPQWKNYPKRNKSLICSNEIDISENFGDLYCVFPMGNPKIGICPTSDIWTSFYRSTQKIFGEELDAEAITSIVESLAEEFDVRINDSSLESLRHSFYEIELMIKNTENVVELFYGDKFSIRVVKYILKSSVDEPMLKLMNGIFSPRINGFNSIPLSKLTNLPSANEMWVSAPSILVSKGIVENYLLK